MGFQRGAGWGELSSGLSQSGEAGSGAPVPSS